MTGACGPYNLGGSATNLRRFNIKLKSEKCIFRVPKGKLLGYIVFEHDIEANPKKIMAISNMALYAMSRAYEGLPAIWLP